MKNKLLIIGMMVLLVGMMSGILFLNNIDNQKKISTINHIVNLEEPMNIIQEKVSLDYEPKNKLVYKEVLNG